MKKSIRILSVLIALGISVSALAGCKKKPVDSIVDPDTKIVDVKPGNPELPLVTEPTKFTMWMPIDGDVTATMQSLEESEYWKELERRTGVTIEFIHPTMGGEQDAFNILIASGDYPDMMSIMQGAIGYPGGYDRAIADGVILNLRDLVKKYAPNYYEHINSSPDILRLSVTDEGNIPAFFMSGIEAQPAWAGITVRQDWLDDLGLEKPETYDEWEVMLRAFKDEKGASAPLMLFFNGFLPFDTLNGGFGVGQGFYREGSRVKFGPLEPGYKEYVTLMNKWYNEGLIFNDFATNYEWIPSATFTATGKAGVWNDVYVLFPVSKMQSDDPNHRAAAIPSPVKNKGDKNNFRQFNNKVQIQATVITDNCKDPITAVRWLDYAYSPDGIMLSNYGIEGKTYRLNEQGNPEFTELIYRNPDGLTFTQALRKFVRHPMGGFGYRWERELVGQPEDVLEAGDIWGRNNDGSAVMPPVTLTNEEGAEFSSIMADIETYINEKVVQFILGREPLSKFDDFVKQIRAMNIERALKLQQDALDRFNSRN
jgi:putative aldouronate transport system substrate-binding protein